LQWDASSDSDVVSYNVYRWTGSDWTRIGTTTAESPVFVDGEVVLEQIHSDISLPYATGTALLQGKSYSYEVTAVDAVGNESDAAGPVAATPTDDNTPPSRPSGLEVTGMDGALYLEWNRVWDPSDESGWDTVAYGIFLGTSYSDLQDNISTGTMEAWRPQLRSPNKIIYGLDNGQRYYCAVVAYDATGNASDAVIGQAIGR